jgi:hypothetical protein
VYGICEITYGEADKVKNEKKYSAEIKKEILDYFSNQLSGELFWKDMQAQWDQLLPRGDKTVARRRKHYVKSIIDKRNKLKLVKEMLKKI